MKISIVTPHFNDFEGVKEIFECLKNQRSNYWEWIIVDDFSNGIIRDSVKKYFKNKDCSNIQLIFNETKTNASFCRNIGIDHANYNKIVFLDSDDFISEDFIENRTIEIDDLTVFRNTNILDEMGNNKPSPTATSNYLDYFLRAKFIWPITAVLWNKDFLIKIGKFNSDLKLLEDIELSIRALLLSDNYKVIDNKVDFYYCVAPIDTVKRPVRLISESVEYLISNLNNKYNLTSTQRGLVKGYYFLCTRYYYKSKNKKDLKHLKKSLLLFYTKKYISFIYYMLGLLFILLLQYNVVSHELFLKLNRYFFK